MPNWKLTYDSFDPAQEMTREALTSTGNGFFCTRGAAEWADCSNDIHYPATYMHGGFNRVTSIISGRPNSNEDLVNLPNWLSLKLRIGDSDPFALDNVEILSYLHEFDMRRAVVSRTLRFRDKEGRETKLESRRFVSMQRMHLAGLEWVVTPENWSGKVEVISALDGRVINWGVPVYRKFEARHLVPLMTQAVDSDIISLVTRTSQSRIHIAEAARTRVFEGENEIAATRTLQHQDDYIHQVLAFDARQGVPFRVEKMVALYSSKDRAISEPLMNAQIAVRRSCDFAKAYERQDQAWAAIWATSDFKLPASDEAQMLLRFNACHIFMCCSPHTGDLDAAAPARGLTGEHYHGRIFWDEMYIYPFLNFRLPEITRGLLMYRYRRLDEARERAREAGVDGAMYPWQSGSDGREETHEFNYNWNNGKWVPDHSHNQRHVNAAIFYNVWNYYGATRDVDFMWNHGARMMLEIARYFASLTHFNAERDRYEIHGVMGPDEYHEKDFGRGVLGVRNNAYTNVMSAWLFKTAIEALDLFPEKRRKRLCQLIDLTDEEIAEWDRMSRRMFVPFHKDGMISQFEGYEDLLEIDLDAYRKKYKHIHRMDMLLKAEGDTPDRYKLAKQADTLMLFYLFPDAELKSLFERLGYAYDEGTLRRNFDYYYKRCSHCSTLSLIVHAAIMADVDPARAWEMYLEALKADIVDVQGGTTKEGIHMGIMAGTLDLMQRGFMGMEIRDGVLHFAPKPLPQLEGLSVPMVWRNTPLKLNLADGALSVMIEPGESGQAVTVCVGGKTAEIQVGETHRFPLTGPEEKKLARAG